MSQLIIVSILTICSTTQELQPKPTKKLKDSSDIFLVDLFNLRKRNEASVYIGTKTIHGFGQELRSDARRKRSLNPPIGEGDWQDDDMRLSNFASNYALLGTSREITDSNYTVKLVNDEEEYCGTEMNQELLDYLQENKPNFNLNGKHLTNAFQNTYSPDQAPVSRRMDFKKENEEAETVSLSNDVLLESVSSGAKRLESKSTSAKIIGGEKAAKGAFPWMVALVDKEKVNIT